MAFATPEDRVALLQGDFPSSFTVQIVTRTGHEVELAADGVKHALYISADWMERGAHSTEIFRILPDGTLNLIISCMERTK